MKTTTLFVFILISAGQIHGNEKVTKWPANFRLAGGEEATPHSFPYQVALFFSAFLCGGSLISDKWVLTTTSCALIYNKPPKVVLGAHRLQDQEDTQVVLTASRVIIHEDFEEDDSYKNDIALVELPEAIPLNENIQIVALPPANAGAFVGELGQVSGWGSGNLYNLTTATTLRYYNDSVISNVACQNVYGVGINIWPTKMCLRGQEGSTCGGDYGGPLVVKDENGNPVQVGIATSVGLSGDCHINYPPAFTRVSSFIFWIEENTGLNLHRV